jgi:CheY-like chemotaxis protein/anti-sigma regulatory factor (Ser/Thr protein kinase)
LINLITNAVHAISGRGGVICVSVETVEHVLNNRSHASPIESAKCVRVEVSDNGKGMDPSTLDRIFEPFFTTKPRGEGTGIGLSVVHGIVHSFGGDIEVSSKLGVGTTFTLHFPQTGESTPLPEEDDEDASKSVPGGLGQRILYVDDDESIVFLMTRMLRRNGYHVLGFDTCEHALAALNADPMGFALLVTDFNMPGMSGLELAVEARKIAQSMPIALASGFVTDEMRIQANEVGIQEVIFKASLVEDFCAAVERILAS